jgi:hypothetical protein
VNANKWLKNNWVYVLLFVVLAFFVIQNNKAIFGEQAWNDKIALCYPETRLVTDTNYEILGSGASVNATTTRQVSFIAKYSNVEQIAIAISKNSGMTGDLNSWVTDSSNNILCNSVLPSSQMKGIYKETIIPCKSSLVVGQSYKLNLKDTNSLDVGSVFSIWMYKGATNTTQSYIKVYSTILTGARVCPFSIVGAS